MPAPCRSDGCDLAVVALSARALARSARRAGLRALAIDLFADEDTREHASLAVRAGPARCGLGFARRSLLEALKTHTPDGAPVVFGAGLEHDPGLMSAIARRNPIIGASPETVRRLKNPVAFAALLARLAIPHPALFETEPPVPVLTKRVGASGGGHIRDGAAFGHGRYVQARVEGRGVSALFLADGARVRLLGFSEQWPDPAAGRPYRFGGAAGPIVLRSTLSDAVTEALSRIAAASGLVGLASADLILPKGHDGGFVLIEINPRPGATLDVFEANEGPSLLALHIEACAGRLPAGPLPPGPARAAAVVYAERRLSVATLPRPVWTADWPSCDDVIPRGAPLCTIVAAARTPSAARALLDSRRADLLAMLRGAPALKTASKTKMVPA